MSDRENNKKRDLDSSDPSPESKRIVSSEPPTEDNITLSEIHNIIGDGNLNSTRIESASEIGEEPDLNETVNNDPRGSPGGLEAGRVDSAKAQENIIQLSGQEKYRLELFKQVGNRYTEVSSPPYVVYIFDKDVKKNLGNYHPVMLGERLRELDYDLKTVNSAGSEKFVVQFETWKQANSFVEKGILEINREWLAIIPDSSIYTVGIIHQMPTEYDEERAWKGIDTRSKRLIKKIECIKRRITPEEEKEEDNSEFENTGVIKIFVEGPLPPAIWVNANLKIVDKYIPKIKRCFRCQRYGHILGNCSHLIRCVRCGGGHRDDDCHRPIQCCNCGEPHLASDRECVIFKFNVDVVTLRSALGNNLKEATYMTQALYQAEQQIFIEDSRIVNYPVAYFGNPEQELHSDSEEELELGTSRVFHRRKSAPGMLLSGANFQRGGDKGKGSEESKEELVRVGRDLFGQLKGRIRDQLNNDPEALRLLKSLEKIALLDIGGEDHSVAGLQDIQGSQ